MAITITGVAAQIRYGYYCAATLRTWTLDAAGLTVAATIVDSNAIWLSQRPLAFVFTDKYGAWTWPVIELQITDGALIARLGPRETTRGDHRQAEDRPTATQ
jgi:hypothetical protein